MFNLHLFYSLIKVKYLSLFMMELILKISQALDVLGRGEHVHPDPAVIVLQLQAETTAC